MKAIRVSEFGGPEVLKLLSDVPVPTPGRRQVRTPLSGTPVSGYYPVKYSVSGYYPVKYSVSGYYPVKYSAQQLV